MFNKLIEGLYFVRIVISPLLVGLIIGGLLYFYLDKGKMGLFLFEIFSLLGLAVGIYWAIFISKKEKPSDFFSVSHPSENNEEKSETNN
jgi:F0F1-type ATP synthase assembly protein I